MSEVQSLRVRSQRTAVAAAERARLTVVAKRPSSAPRAPFAVLVFLILGAGVVGLLMFNTQMQQASIYATKLEATADQLEARSQSLSLQLERERDPQQVAEKARKLGMVTPPNPAVLDLQNDKILGVPLAASADDGTRVRPPRTPLPGALNRKPVIKFVTGGPAAGQTTSGNGAASGGNDGARGTNETQNKPADGANR